MRQSDCWFLRRLSFAAASSVRFTLPADERVMLRQVRLGRRYGDSIEVLAGLSEGELVAAEPVAAGIYLKEQSGAK